MPASPAMSSPVPPAPAPPSDVLPSLPLPSLSRLSRREVAAARGRLSLTVATIALGVGFVVSAGAAGASVSAAFADVSAVATRGTDVAAVYYRYATVSGVDTATVERIAAVEGVAAVATAVTAPVVVSLPDGESVTDATGVNLYTWSVDPGLQAFAVVAGTPPTVAGDVLLDRASADRAGLSLGDPVVLSSRGGEVSGHLVGTVTVDGQDGLAGRPFPIVAVADAETLAGRPGADVVRVRGDGSADVAVLMDRVDAVVSQSGAIVMSGSEYATAFDFDSAVALPIRVLLTAFAVVALVVGGFLTANTFAMVVSQRRRQFALLRAVGATRRQVRRSILREALLVSLTGSALGVLAGVGLGWLALRALPLIGLDLPVAGLRLDPLWSVGGVLLGVSFGVVAARRAARQATRVAPVDALRDAAVEEAIGRGVARTVIGLVMLAGAVVLVGWVDTGDVNTAAVPAMVGAVLGVLALVVLNPVLVRLVTPMLHRLLPGGGAAALVAARNTARNPRRVAATTSAMLVGLVFAVAAATVGASASSSFGGAYERGLRDTDALVTAGWASIDDEVTARVADVPEVAEVATTDYGLLSVGPGSLDATFASDNIGSFIDPAVVSGVGLNELSEDEVALSVRKADELGVSLGDAIEVTNFSVSDGVGVTVTVTSLYTDEDILFTAVFIGDPLRSLDSGDGLGSWNLYLRGQPGVEPAELVSAVDAVVNPVQGTVATTSDRIADAQGFVGQALLVLFVLLGVTLLITFLGIVNTAVLSMLERTHEIGLLRATGATRRQVASMVRRETMVVALYGALLGVVAGLALGLAVTARLSAVGLTTVAVPWVQIGGIAVAAVVAGLLAAYLPARRAAGLRVLDAVRTA